MAFGQHWEWRGFGRIDESLRRRLEALPLKFPDAQRVTDEYLWSPRCKTNVKLRFGDLKLKRLVRVEDDLELWLEDPDENYAFPVEREPLLALFDALGAPSVPVPEHPVGREELLALLGRHASEVRLVAVEKSRHQHELLEVAPAKSGEGIVVELAEIYAPERILSVGLEHEDREAVARARDAFDFGSRMRRLNYFEALAIWAQGGTVGSSE